MFLYPSYTRGYIWVLVLIYPRTKEKPGYKNLFSYSQLYFYVKGQPGWKNIFSHSRVCSFIRVSFSHRMFTNPLNSTSCQLCRQEKRKVGDMRKIQMAQASFEPRTSLSRVLRSAVAPHWFELGKIVRGGRVFKKKRGSDDKIQFEAANHNRTIAGVFGSRIWMS